MEQAAIDARAFARNAGAARPLSPQRKLRVGWALEAPDCKTGVASVVDSLSYRCLFYDALNTTMKLIPVTKNSTAHTRGRLDVILLPHVCTINTRALPVCLGLLKPSDPPAVIVLNKVFEALDKKLALIGQYRQQARYTLAFGPASCYDTRPAMRRWRSSSRRALSPTCSGRKRASAPSSFRTRRRSSLVATPTTLAQRTSMILASQAGGRS